MGGREGLIDRIAGVRGEGCKLYTETHDDGEGGREVVQWEAEARERLGLGSVCRDTNRDCNYTNPK
jgi:hypothetical protein